MSSFREFFNRLTDGNPSSSKYASFPSNNSRRQGAPSNLGLFPGHTKHTNLRPIKRSRQSEENPSRKHGHQNDGSAPHKQLSRNRTKRLKSELAEPRSKNELPKKRIIELLDGCAGRLGSFIPKVGENEMTNYNLGTLSGVRLQEIGHRLKEETLRCQNLQVALGRTTNELARLKSLEPRFGSNDDVIVSKWKTIRSFIRQFAHNYSRDLMYSKGFFNYGHQNHGFRSLTPNFDRYVRTHERRSRLFQAFIWRWLLLNIFRTPTIIFGEGHATEFNALLNTFTAASKKLTEKEYANWRAYTSTMISKSCGISDSGIEKLALALEEQLLALLPTKYYRENARVGLLGSVREVVSQATELAEVFLYSIPQYQGHMPTGLELRGFEIDEQSMEVVGKFYTTRNIDLIVSPYLVKRGSSFGENYDQAVILIKAEVLT